jgi:hypothetical protein
MNIISKILKNKRGEDMLVDFWAILVFATIMILFLILFSVNKTIHQNQIQDEFQNKDAEIMLISFINAPAIGTGLTSDKTVGEIIVEDASTGDFTNTKILFKNYFSEASSGSIIYLEINRNDEEYISMKIDKSISIFERTLIFSTVATAPTIIIIPKGETYSAQTYLPGFNGEKIYIKLKKKIVYKNN